MSPSLCHSFFPFSLSILLSLTLSVFPSVNLSLSFLLFPSLFFLPFLSLSLSLYHLLSPSFCLSSLSLSLSFLLSSLSVFHSTLSHYLFLFHASCKFFKTLFIFIYIQLVLYNKRDTKNINRSYYIYILIFTVQQESPLPTSFSYCTLHCPFN